MQDEPPAEGGSGVRSNVGRGALIVRDGQGQAFRLTWESEAADATAARELPAGRYVLVGYRRRAVDPEGTPWFLSATGHEISSFEVEAGAVTEVPVPAGVTLTHKAVPGHGAVQIQMGFQGAHHAGITLYRDGVRIPVAYVVRDGKGDELARGMIRYG